jgi:RNA polymerase sigma-70 factor, ECF subfamily
MSNSSRHEEFVELLRQHRSQLFGYIYALLHNLDDAEDVYQETSLVLWNKFDEYVSGTHFFRWACVVARNRAAMFLRQKRRHRRYFSPEFQEELATIQADTASTYFERLQEALVDCMKKLPGQDRELIAMCYGARQTFKQAAVQLGRPVQSIYDALCRIRHRLSECVHRAAAKDEHPNSTEERP